MTSAFDMPRVALDDPGDSGPYDPLDWKLVDVLEDDCALRIAVWHASLPIARVELAEQEDRVAVGVYSRAEGVRLDIGRMTCLRVPLGRPLGDRRLIDLATLKDAPSASPSEPLVGRLRRLIDSGRDDCEVVEPVRRPRG